MQRKTLGAFVDKSRVTTPREFYLHAWNCLVDGPEILRPKRVGNVEPLKRVEDVLIEKILSQDFIVSNGRKFLGMISPPDFPRALILLSHAVAKPGPEGGTLCRRDYEWLRTNFPSVFCIWALPRQNSFSATWSSIRCSSGLVEITLESALHKYKHLLDRFERAA